MIFDRKLLRRARCSSADWEEIDALAERILALNEKAQREGILSLEEEFPDIQPPILAWGVHMLVNSCEPERIRAFLVDSAGNSKVRGRELMARIVVTAGMWCIHQRLDQSAVRWFLEETLLGTGRTGKAGKKHEKIQSLKPVKRPDSLPETPQPSGKVDDATLDSIVVDQGIDAGEQLLVRVEASDLVKTCAEATVAGRNKEIEALEAILLQAFKPNAFLVGDPGVGKTSIVRGLARRIAAGEVPERLHGTRIIAVKIIDALAREIKEFTTWLEKNPQAILFIDEAHLLGGKFGPGETILGGLYPALQRGTIRCIACTTLTEYYRELNQLESLTRRFQTLRVEEPHTEEVLPMLAALAPQLEAHYAVKAGPGVLEKVVQLSGEYMTGQRYPDKAVELLDRAFCAAQLSGIAMVGEEHLLKAVRDASGSTPGVANPLDGLESRLESIVLGQKDAISAAVRVIRLCRQKLDLKPERPDGVLLFLGPSGVGKTELAKVLARELTGRDAGLSRLDMSEYREDSTLSSLLGSPFGYIGSNEQSILSRIAGTNPTGILLLDEFEKAHPSVHRVFLQIFDEGRATDRQGRTLNFSRMTIIATTNAGGSTKRPVGFTPESEASGTRDGLGPSLMAALTEIYPLELLNRFDEIIPFRLLSRDDCVRIIGDLLVPEARKRAELAGVALTVTQACMDAIVDAGYRPEFAARGLNRAFQDLLLHPLAEALTKGGKELTADVFGGRVRIISRQEN